MKRLYTFLGCIFALALCLSGCQKDEKEVTKIILAPQKVQVGIGKTAIIYANPFPDSGDKGGLSWSTDDNSIATVDQNGVITGVSNGTTYVNVQFGSLKESALVEVYESLTNITLSPSALTVNLEILFGAAESIKYTAEPIPSNSTETILWKSSDVKVATVSQTGLITAIGAGNAIVTVEGSGGFVKKEITVTVKKTGDDPLRFDSKLFSRQILPGDNFLNKNDGWPLEKIWDGNRASAGGSSCSLPGPQSFTFDMGAVGNLAYFHLFTWKSLGEGYPPFSEGNVKKFEVWGSESLDASGSWDSWTKLMDCEVIKPSGLPIMQYNAADVQASDAGQKFYNQSNYNVKVRYIRVKVLQTWEGIPCFRICEIELYGRPQ